MTKTAEPLSAPLIRPATTGKAAGPVTDPRPEAAFQVDEQCGLTPVGCGPAEGAKAFFAHAVARHPANLRRHIQRIVLHARTQDPAILGAVCDLFLVLGNSGRPLRQRMLALARPLLSGMDYQTLRRRLEHPESDAAPLHAITSGAVLSRGFTGNTRLIAKQSSTGETAEDPLESARDQLAYGQTEQAQATLERALPADPERLALHLALLEIYRHARDRRRVEHTWRALQGKPNPARNEWQRLLAQLDEEAQAS